MKGITYFPQDISDTMAVELIEAEFGFMGYALIIKLKQQIFAENGYYMPWNTDSLMLFAKRTGLSKEQLNEVVQKCCDRGIFDRELCDTYGVLTNKEIQESFQTMTKRRKDVEYVKEYLLIDKPTNGKLISVEKPKAIISKKEIVATAAENAQVEEVKAEDEILDEIEITAEHTEEETEEKTDTENIREQALLHATDDFVEEYLLKGKMKYHQYSELMKTGCNDDLIGYAIKQAIDYGKENFAYIKAIVNNHVKEGRLTRAEAEKVTPPKKKSGGYTPEYKQYGVFEDNGLYDYADIEKKSMMK